MQSFTFEKLRLVSNFLLNLGVLWLLCSFRLVLKGKAGKEITESSRLELFANSFGSSEAEENTSDPSKRRGIADLPLVRTLLADSPKVARVKLFGEW